MTEFRGSKADVLNNQYRVRGTNGLIEFQNGTTIIQLPIYTTTERDAVSSPQRGYMIFNDTTNKINFYSGSAWEAVTST